VKRGPRVVVTRAEGADGPLTRALQERGATVLCVPSLAFAAPEDEAPLERAFASLARFDWLLLTSPHAAELVSSRWGRAIAEAQPRLRVAAVGAATAAPLRQAGLRVDLTPPRTDALGLADALQNAGDLRGARLLWPRANAARLELAERLRALGADVIDPVAYRTQPGAASEAAKLRQLLERKQADAVTFLSPSALDGLLAAWGEARLRELLGATVVASLGPVTSAALRDAGVPPHVESPERSVVALAEALMSALHPPIGARG
jgi:uroporphyrinogen III methyltransferase/synthase